MRRLRIVVRCSPIAVLVAKPQINWPAHTRCVRVYLCSDRTKGTNCVRMHSVTDPKHEQILQSLSLSMARKGSALRHRKHSTTEKKRKASLPRDIKYELKRMGQKETDIREAVQALRSADSPARSPLSPGCSLPTPGVKLVPIAGAGRSPSKTPRKKDKKNVKLSKSMQPQRPNQSPNDSRRWGPSIRRTKITDVSPI